MRVAYADPPYPGYAHYYREHPDFGGEVDHRALIASLDGYDGYVLHTSANTLPDVLALYGELGLELPRVMAWVKTWAPFRRGVPVAYAWEPVLVRACRAPVVHRRRSEALRGGALVMRDWIGAPVAMRRDLRGAKPAAVCSWAFAVVGLEPDDELVDLFPGTGAVTRAWEHWRSQVQESLL